MRLAVCERVEVFAAGHELPYKEATHAHPLRVPKVFPQLPPAENDDESDVPCFVVRIGDDTEAESPDGDVSVVTADVTIEAFTFCKDSEQGYRDAENLIEALKIDLRQSPWVDIRTEDLGLRTESGARYRLFGPWKISVADTIPTIFKASLACSIEGPGLVIVSGPGGESIADMI